MKALFGVFRMETNVSIAGVFGVPVLSPEPAGKGSKGQREGVCFRNYC